MKANASLGSNLPYEKIEDDIQKYIQEVQEKDIEEDLLYGPENSGNEVPEELKHSDRMKRFKRQKSDLRQNKRKSLKRRKIR